MREHIDFIVLLILLMGIGLIAVFIIHRKTANELKKSILLLYGSIFIFLCLALFFKYLDVLQEKEKRKNFKNGDTFICFNSFADNYLVSHEKGWYLISDNITNGDIVYRIKHCEKANQNE